MRSPPQLWALKQQRRRGGSKGARRRAAISPPPGRTSFVADATINKGLYRAAGFRVCGERAVRVDILERLADLIRPAIAYRPGTTAGDPPPGTADGDGFVVTVGMTSLAGCSAEAFGTVLKSLGYVVDRRAGPAITVPLVPKASTEPVQPVVAAVTPSAEEQASETIIGDAPSVGSAAAEELSSAGTTADANPADNLESRVSLARQSELIAAALEGGALEAIEPLPQATAAEQAPATDETFSDEQTPAAEQAPEIEQPMALEAAPGHKAAAEVEHAETPEADAAEVEALVEAREAADGETAGPAAVVHSMFEGVSGEPSAAEIAEASPVSVAADAEMADGPVSDTIASEAPAEPVEVPMIEVWRPHRHNVHNRRPAGDARGRGPRRSGGAGYQGQRPPRDGAVQPPGETVPVAAEGEARPQRPEGQTRNYRFRDFKRPGGGDGAPVGRDGHRGPPRGGNAGGDGRGDNRGRDRRDGSSGSGNRRDGGRAPSFQTTEAPKPRERDRQPDPNSPFAKLAALKAQMEKDKS